MTPSAFSAKADELSQNVSCSPASGRNLGCADSAQSSQEETFEATLSNSPGDGIELTSTARGSTMGRQNETSGRSLSLLDDAGIARALTYWAIID
jgi:hypothetical protein